MDTELNKKSDNLAHPLVDPEPSYGELVAPSVKLTVQEPVSLNDKSECNKSPGTTSQGSSVDDFLSDLTLQPEGETLTINLDHSQASLMSRDISLLARDPSISPAAHPKPPPLPSVESTSSFDKTQLDSMCDESGKIMVSEGVTLGSCVNCGRLRAALRQVMGQLMSAQQQVRLGDEALKQEQRSAQNFQKSRADVDRQWSSALEDARAEATMTRNKSALLEKALVSLKRAFESDAAKTRADVEALRADVAASRQLQAEVAWLRGKYTKCADILSLPTLPHGPAELREMCARLRDECIAARTAREAAEEATAGELQFTRQQLLGERQERQTIEETLTAEISALQERVAVSQSFESEYHREKALRESLEAELQLTGGARAGSLSPDRKMEEEVYMLRAKNASLAHDLENTEHVQAELVKLSQNLQVQLEKLRSEDGQVRWQHEDDVRSCDKCDAQFVGGGSKKLHCSHCGRIHCAKCLTKEVTSGPNARRFPVCQVCHTLLDKEAQPYFGVDAPPPGHS